MTIQRPRPAAAQELSQSNSTAALFGAVPQRPWMQNATVLPGHVPQAGSRPTLGRNLTISTQTPLSDHTQPPQQFVSGFEVGGHPALHTRSSMPTATDVVNATSTTGRSDVRTAQSPMLPSPAPSDDQNDNFSLTVDFNNQLNVQAAPSSTPAPLIPSPSSLQPAAVLRSLGASTTHNAPGLSSIHQGNTSGKRSSESFPAEQQKRHRLGQRAVSVTSQAHNVRRNSISRPCTSTSQQNGSNGPRNIRHNSSPQSPQASFLLCIDRFLTQQAAVLTPLDRQRCDLLKEACKNDDHFYLCLHQMFCSLHYENLIGNGGLTYDVGVKAGIRHLSGLIKPNTELSFVALQFFSYSLSPPHMTTSLTLNDEYRQQATRFLQRLGESWKQLAATCSQRGYPFSVEEMEDYLLLSSPTLQSVCFRALHHMLSGSVNTFLGGCTDRLFNHNRQQFVERAITGSLLSSQEKQALIINFGSEYRSLLGQWAQNGQNLQQPPIQRRNRHPQALQSQVQTVASTNGQPSSTRMNAPLNPAIGVPNVQWTSGGRLIGDTSTGTPPSMLDAYAQQYRALAAISGGSQGPGVQQMPNSILRQPTAPVPLQRNSSLTTPVTAAAVTYVNPLHNTTSAGSVVFGPRGASASRASLTSQDFLSDSLAHLLEYSTIPYQKLDRSGSPNPALRLYRVLKAIKLGPFAVSPKWPNLQYHFEIVDSEWLAKVKDTAALAGTAPQRQYGHGLLLFRLRCARVSGDCREFTEDQWVVQDHVWPRTVFVTINGIHAELRKKDIHGKDFPVDLTPFIRQGQNFIEISCLVDTDELGTSLYAFAIEMIGVVDEEWVKQQPQSLPLDKSLAFITRGLSLNAEDDDLTVVDPYLSIDLVDPFMATMFSIPVRGKNCLHRECFDLETYLQTRKAQSKGMPTGADDWKCPICRKDARPMSLVIDSFLTTVRQKLKEDDRLDAKALHVKPDGTWEAKYERHDEDKRIRSQTPGLTAPDENDRNDAVNAVVIDLDDD